MAALPADDAHGPQRFRRALVSRLDEPVRRYLTHAIAEGALLGPAAELRMSGWIKVGAWLPFAATERCSARSFEWRAGVGWGRVRPLRVLDSYAAGRGYTRGRLLGRMTLFEACAVAERWGNARQKEFGHIPCGCEVHAERRFGEVVLPSRVTVGWWFGTPRYAPFFRSEITDLAPYRGASPLGSARREAPCASRRGGDANRPA